MSDPVVFDSFDLAALRKALFDWYRPGRRALPWRHPGRTSDKAAWSVWVSEIMLQQTRAEVVAERLEPFLTRFPNPRAMASSDVEDVLAAWSGLGYYRRARNLHAAARVVASEHEGLVPDSRERLLGLPGVGDYTAAAVASIAFGEVAAAIDGNVERVLTRLLAIQEDPKRGAARRQLRSFAAAILDPQRPGDWNEAMMDLGALVCTPRSPSCLECPLATGCRAHAQGLELELPKRAQRSVVRAMPLASLVAVSQQSVLLLERSKDQGWMPGFWELPTVTDGPDCAQELTRLVFERTGLRVSPLPANKRIRHSIVDRRLEVVLFYAELTQQKIAGEGWCLADADKRDSLPLSSLVAKCLKKTGPSRL